jgi:4-carboxymuconolactone decarboxylase
MSCRPAVSAQAWATGVTVPRLSPLPADEQHDDLRNLLQRLAGPEGTPNLYTTLARNEALFRRWLSFGAALMHGSLPPRVRELLILRIAWRCRSDYEFGQHTVIAKTVGLSAEEILRVADRGGGWTAPDAAVIRAADELHDNATLTEATWSALREQLDDAQLIEFLMVAGQYHLVAYCANAIAIERDEGLPGLPG